MVVLDILWAALGPFICYFGGWLIGAALVLLVFLIAGKIKR